MQHRCLSVKNDDQKQRIFSVWRRRPLLAVAVGCLRRARVWRGGMLSARVGQLEADLTAADSQLAAARAAVRACQQAVKDKRRRTWVLTEWLAHVVLLIYGLAGYTAEPAVLYLAHAARKRKWPEKQDDEVTRIVEDTFMSVDVHVFAHLLDASDPADLSALKEATKYVEQWRLFSWAREQNVAHGIAPTTASVLVRYAALRLALPEAVRPAAAGDVTQSVAREWARRWRLRFGGRFGRLRVREDLTDEEAQEKARVPHRPHRLYKVAWARGCFARAGAR